MGITELNKENIQKNIDVSPKNIDSRFSELLNNSPSFQLEKIETVFSGMSMENKVHCTNLINNVCSRDPNVVARGDFMGTLSKIETLTV